VGMGWNPTGTQWDSFGHFQKFARNPRSPLGILGIYWDSTGKGGSVISTASNSLLPIPSPLPGILQSADVLHSCLTPLLHLHQPGFSTLSTMPSELQTSQDSTSVSSRPQHVSSIYHNAKWVFVLLMNSYSLFPS
jgi:hypothetical protein